MINISILAIYPDEGMRLIELYDNSSDEEKQWMHENIGEWKEKHE